MTSWIFGLINLSWGLWSKRPNPLAEQAYTAGESTRAAEDNQKTTQVTAAELQAAVNGPDDAVSELEKGTF